MPRRHPDWIKVKAPGNPNYLRLKRLMREKNLHTVCEEARCPNIGECWGNKTATFLILGDTCTRGCRFCAIDKGKPLALDPEEPRNVGLVVKDLGLDHIVVTSVNRDDLPDGGAAHFAKTVFWIKSHCYRRSIRGKWEALRWTCTSTSRPRSTARSAGILG